MKWCVSSPPSDRSSRAKVRIPHRSTVDPLPPPLPLPPDPDPDDVSVVDDDDDDDDVVPTAEDLSFFSAFFSIAKEA